MDERGESNQDPYRGVSHIKVPDAVMIHEVFPGRWELLGVTAGEAPLDCPRWLGELDFEPAKELTLWVMLQSGLCGTAPGRCEGLRQQLMMIPGVEGAEPPREVLAWAHMHTGEDGEPIALVVMGGNHPMRFLMLEEERRN